jgi:hypothetical protein
MDAGYHAQEVLVPIIGLLVAIGSFYILYLLLAIYWVAVLWALLGAALIVASVLLFLALRDVWRVLRFYASSLSIASESNIPRSSIFSLHALRSNFQQLHRPQKRSPDEVQDLWIWAYHPGLSLGKLFAFAMIREEAQTIVLSSWVARVYLCSWFRLAQESSGATQTEAIQTAKQEAHRKIKYLGTRELKELLPLYKAYERPAVSVEWAEQAIHRFSHRRVALALLQKFSEEQDFVGAKALFALLQYYQKRNHYALAFHYFELHAKHPKATKTSEAHRLVRILFAPSISNRSVFFGRSIVGLYNTQSATWSLSPLEIEKVPFKDLLQNPANALHLAPFKEDTLRGSLRLIRIPFTRTSFGFFRLPRPLGSFRLLLEATANPFEAWERHFGAPIPKTEHQERSQNHTLDAVLSLTESNAFLWVMDKKTPIPNQEVIFVLQDPGESFEERRVMTDSQGLATLSGISFWQLGAMVKIPGEAGGAQCIFLTHNSEASTQSNDTSALRFYLWMARPMYKPGETVSGVLIGRNKKAELPSTPETHSYLQLSIRAPNGTVLKQLPLKLSLFGTASFSFEIPEKVTLGKYTFAVDIRSQKTIVEGNFYIEDFVAPEFKASLVSQKEAQWGEALSLNFEASYFFGGAVPDAVGELEIERRDWSYIESGAWPPNKYSKKIKKLHPIKIQTKTDGKAEIRIPWRGLPAWLTPSFFRRVDGCTFICKARVRDASGKTCEASLSLVVGRLASVVGVELQKSLYLPNEEASFLIQRHQEQGQTKSPQTIKLVFSRYWGLSRRTVSMLVQPEQAEIRCKLPISAGKWSLRAHTNKQRALRSPQKIYLLDEKLYSRQMRMLTATSSLQEGESVRVALLGPKKASGSHVLLQYNSGPRLKSQILPWQGGSLWTDIPTQVGDAPSMHLRCWFGDKAGELTSLSESLSLSQKDATPKIDALPLSLSFTSKHFSPGAETIMTATFDGTVNDDCELICRVVDEALFSLVPAPRDPLLFFEEALRSEFTKAAWSAPYKGAQHGRAVPTYNHYDSSSGGRDFKKSKSAVYADSDEGGMMPMSGAMPSFSSAPMAPQGAPMARMEMMAAAPKSRGGLSLPSFDFSMNRKSAPVAMREEVAAPPIQARSDFSSEAAWYPDIFVSPGEEKPLYVKFTDSLTTWRASAFALSSSRIGSTETSVQTQKPLMVRLQTPRFLQERDSFTLLALLDSRAEETQQIRANIQTEGLEVSSPIMLSQSLSPNEQAKLSGEVKVLSSQKSELVLRAEVFSQNSPDINDAEERKLLYRPYGSMQKKTFRGVLTQGDLSFTLPEERQKEHTKISLRLDRGPLDAVLQALSYLREYPYGCVEQTCSRFIPYLVWEKVIEKKFPKSGSNHPYRGLEVVPSAVIESSLKRLTTMQNADGGYGWWSKSGSDIWMTSYVVFCFALARQLPQSSAYDFLRQNILNLQNPDDADAFAAFALAWGGIQVEDRVREVLLSRWENLSLSEKAKLCWVLLDAKHPEALVKLNELCDDVLPRAKKFLKKVAKNDGKESYWFRPRATEAISFLVMALIKAQDDSLRSTLQTLISFLLLHRSEHYWHSTRDTGLAVLALLLYEESLGDAASSATLRVLINRKEKAALKLEALSKDPPVLFFSDEDGNTGENSLQFVTEGLDKDSIAQPKHYTLSLQYFSTEQEIPANTQGIEIKRAYWLLDEKQKEVRALKPNDSIKIGQRLRVELKIKASKVLTYALIEDPKLAGCEPISKKSGPEVCKGFCSHVELRADKTAIFLGVLTKEEQVLSYEIEAQIPGVFTAMPARVETMYDDEFFGSTESFKLQINNG